MYANVFGIRRADSARNSASAVLPWSRLASAPWQLLHRLGVIAQAHQASVAAVPLVRVRQQPLLAATIFGARTVEQVTANLVLLEVTLTPPELAELDGLTVPDLNFPLPFLREMGVPAQQGAR